MNPAKRNVSVRPGLSVAGSISIYTVYTQKRKTQESHLEFVGQQFFVS